MRRHARQYWTEICAVRVSCLALGLATLACQREAEVTPEPPAPGRTAPNPSDRQLAALTQPGSATYATNGRHAGVRETGRLPSPPPSLVVPTASSAPTPVDSAALPPASVPNEPGPSADAGKPVPPAVLDETPHVLRLVVTSSIDEREPVLPPALKLDAPIFAFIELESSAKAPQKIIVTFEPHAGRAVGHVELPVPAGRKRWRTWAQTRHVKQAGEWLAVVRTPSGHELASAAFSLAPAVAEARAEQDRSQQH